MARIAGVDLNKEKRLDIALTALYGVGRQNVKKILLQAEVKGEKRVKDLTADEVARIQKVIDRLPVEGNLRSQVAEDIKRLKIIGSYRGLRHTHGLPSRGQRTRSNARTRRGRRKTVGALKKEDAAKLALTKAEEKSK
jgi:small subunit ribosomal protein S13